MSLFRFLPILSFSMVLASAAAGQDDDKPLPVIAEKARGMAPREGLLIFYIDQKAGTVWLQLDPPAGPDGEIAQLIYVESIRSGLGSNPIGIDRGQLGASRVVRLRRIGPRVVIEQLNLAYRAISPINAEKRAVAESFASSILWGGKIGALDPDGTALVDLSTFLIRDAHDIRASLRDAEQGEFTLDAERSFINLDRAHAFPDNIELEATVTYTSDKPGPLVRATAPDPGAVTLVQRHSFIRLPEPGYRPREFDPRIASTPIEFLDFASGIAQPLHKRWIARHRLEKEDPAAAMSPPKKPIIYYVDPGAPEPIRSALIEGARWWNDGFAAAGFENAFRVEILPEGAHPLDVRYNVIQWVHRSTRGWSYGGSIIDPRTGEIIKGHVSLGSLRVRQDRLIFEGLLGTDQTTTGRPDDPIEIALARIRQLSAHEVGHTLGFAHNFAASTYDNRASVMDYPAPLIRRHIDGSLDLSDAYAVGIGSWDTLCVRYAYSEYQDDEREREGLAAIVDEAAARHRFLSDADARPANAAHPLANLWDNGDDPIAQLEETLAIRRVAIHSFAENRVRSDRPLAELEEVFVPVYFHHRYQLEATAKSIGGLNYVYAVRGDGRRPQQPVSAETQRRALEAILLCLHVQVLDIPDAVMNLLVPRAFQYERHEELFDGSMQPMFDPIVAAATAAEMAVAPLLEPSRLARVVEFHRRDPEQMPVEELLDRVMERATMSVDESASPRAADIHNAVKSVIVDQFIAVARNARTSSVVRSRVERRLRVLADRLIRTAPGASEATRAHHAMLAARIERYLNRALDLPLEEDEPAPAPPGSPIGAPAISDLGECSHGLGG